MEIFSLSPRVLMTRNSLVSSLLKYRRLTAYDQYGDVMEFRWESLRIVSSIQFKNCEGIVYQASEIPLGFPRAFLSVRLAESIGK